MVARVVLGLIAMTEPTAVDPYAEVCAAELPEPGHSKPWLCTLLPGHDGDHEAWTTAPRYPRRRWSTAPRTWSLPPSPGPEVTAVRDDDWAVWQRNPADGSWYEEGEDPGPLGVSWEELLSDFGPLTDATAEVRP